MECALGATDAEIQSAVGSASVRPVLSEWRESRGAPKTSASNVEQSQKLTAKGKTHRCFGHGG